MPPNEPGIGMPWTWQSSSIDAVDANQHKVRHCMAQQASANSHNMIRMLWTQLLSVRYFSSWDIQGLFQQLRRNQLSQFCGEQMYTDAIFRQRNYQSWFVQNHPQPTPLWDFALAALSTQMSCSWAGFLGKPGTNQIRQLHGSHLMSR